ncbi:PREDICTED: nipped-B-like protein B isoform X2 [Tarenaya hassleriana]|uniref:nipped-B-like protein B isoform X1 n=1 Tax=Tarenaya hassleriana TaxID=28532 RepID=UPI00053C5D15|nr:PREDICTED: nipped-B-like protein B isoform X1 [Tarenaya hassleriana]XP_010555726.1 PREDICTED: nipped-B-like protein B isoform X2 [Tarenaya hassleriana]
MPRSSRHKSSKHSSRDAREYSDSEKESTLREKRSSARVSKESGSGDKHKLDNKEYYDSLNGEYYHEYTSSKRRKENTEDDGASGGWIGGDEDRGEISKNSKTSSEKSRRREGEETKKSGSKTDGKHRESSRKESRELEKGRDRDRDRKDREGKGEKFRDGEDRYGSKEASGKTEHSRSGDKLFRGENVASGSKQKNSKFQDNDHEHGHEPDREHDGRRDRSRDYEHSRGCDREYDRNRDRDRDHKPDRNRDRERVRDHHDYERDQYHERDWKHDRSRDQDRDWDHDRDRTSDGDKNHSLERSKSEPDRDFDQDVPHLDYQSGHHKDSGERRRSPDDHDDLSDSKSRTIAAHAGMETRSGRSRPSSSHGAQDDIGHILDQRPEGIFSRDAADLSGGSEGGSKYRASEKTPKMEDSLGELSVERSSSTKASPRGLIAKSPSCTSLERRNINRSGSGPSLGVEETSQRSAYGDKLSRDLPCERPLGDDSLQAELSFSNKTHQSNSSFRPRPESRGGIGSPIVGSLEENSRVNIGGRYKRGGAINMGRGQGNAWRNAPNWPSPVPNGFIPFPHGPPLQPVIPQFPFGVRPSIEMGHSGIPYHMADAERFSGHLPSLGWQNMMDGVGPSHHMHGWDMSNDVFRDEPLMYGGAEWDHGRRMHSQGWESGADAWKAQNGNASMDVSSISQKDDQSGQAVDDDALAGQTSHSENNRAKSVEAGSNLTSPGNDLLMEPPKILAEETSVHPVVETADNAEKYCRYYLAKIDISVELVGAELHTECMSLIMDEQSPIVGDGSAIVINLKDEGKALLSGDYTTKLSAFSSWPCANSSLFQRAMEMYKEERVEVKGLQTRAKEGTTTEEEEESWMKASKAMSGDDEESDNCASEATTTGLPRDPKAGQVTETEIIEKPEEEEEEEEEEKSSSCGGEDATDKFVPESVISSRIHPQTTL